MRNHITTLKTHHVSLQITRDEAEAIAQELRDLVEKADIVWGDYSHLNELDNQLVASIHKISAIEAQETKE